jgi:excisionase family DNA binding protein
MREIMTPNQVAEYLQLTTDTVYRLIREKKLAATQVGRSYRIPREDLEKFLVVNSTRPAVRDALFRNFLAIADQNPGLNSDDVLEELEREDEERKRQAK